MLLYHSLASFPSFNLQFHSSHVHPSSPQCTLPTSPSPLSRAHHAQVIPPLSRPPISLPLKLFLQHMILNWTTSPIQRSIIYFWPSPFHSGNIAGPDTGQNILSVLRKPEFDPKLFVKRVKSLKQCREFAQAIVDIMIRNLQPTLHFFKSSMLYLTFTRTIVLFIKHASIQQIHRTSHFQGNSSPLDLYRIHKPYNKYNNKRALNAQKFYFTLHRPSYIALL